MRLPIRFKILVSQLMVITLVLGVITYTMGRLFHDDKTVYIRDITSVMSQNAAVEIREVLNGYRDRLQTFAQFTFQSDLPGASKVVLLKQLFDDFNDINAIAIYERGVEKATIFDSGPKKSAIANKKIATEQVARALSTAGDIPPGHLRVLNSSITGQSPTLTMIFRPVLKHKDNVTIAAVIDGARINQITKRSKVVNIFLTDTQRNFITHENPMFLEKHGTADWMPDLAVFSRQDIASTTIEYPVNGRPFLAGISRVGVGDLLAIAQIQASTAYVGAQDILGDLIYSALALLLVSSLFGIVWARYLTRPIERLSAAAKVVGQGDFNVKVNYSSSDEIGELANSFDSMTEELMARDRKLKSAQAALVQSEKMSAFGQMSAGIAHEIKNPLAGILGYAQLSKRKLDAAHPVQSYLEVVEKETKRCTGIISNLMQFARQEKFLKERIDLNGVVENAIAIVSHQLNLNGVKIDKKLGGNLPTILGNANQLQQVVMNLAINAQQAMEEKGGGIFELSTYLNQDGGVTLRARDNGPGMQPEIRDKIFEPFFTTKPAGKGTGLGLSVTYGIIRDHDALIRCESTPGEGATFFVDFPAHTGYPSTHGLAAASTESQEKDETGK